MSLCQYTACLLASTVVLNGCGRQLPLSHKPVVALNASACTLTKQWTDSSLCSHASSGGTPGLLALLLLLLLLLLPVTGLQHSTSANRNRRVPIGAAASAIW